MFSGIISELATVKSINKKGLGSQVKLQISSKLIKNISIGNSLSINGVCSTVTKIDSDENSLYFDYLPETVIISNLSELKLEQKINIEHSLRLNDFVHGHFVTGHVDTQGKIIAINKDQEWHVITIKYAKKYEQLLVEKGSVTIEGIALTVVDLKNESFSCHIIPHTFNHTNLKTKQIHDTVNIEFDILGKYVQRGKS
eukprot:COSAG01_NODE_14_length_41020_cov_40.702133_46_plen_198_part_00